MAATVWYFAYGSNMNAEQMRARASQYTDDQVARLENYELLFNKKARGGSAKANIRPAPGKTVYGVLYRIPESSLRTLDRFEGAPEHYRRIEVNVVNAEGNRVPAQVFIATKVEKGLRPDSHYLQAILQAAGERQFPQEYVDEVKQTAGAQ